ncbi:hypothetical protein FHS82_000034 [Pseudochelatococcus lubricantis]|uniref:Uncharacterized protein n=1 Tax=Pseudochelatococcus lubricantis TaxID=1538102 RepID=A0ABX0UTD3_9HYPH|nr:hypothetical protein [Pseudochelatococcus lubricantis]NIJ56221.1 hypothetical protein [Pseudochelatococcus lubricantis]
MADTFPRNAAEFADMALLLAERLVSSNDAGDAFAAILAAAHLPDWYFKADRGVGFGPSQKDVLRKQFPTYGLLLDLGNGVKHAKRAVGKPHPDDLQQELVAWESADFWQHAGHPDHPYWAVEFGGRSRSISALCESFIKGFRKEHQF